MKRIETQNMCMARYFEAPADQVKRVEEFKAMTKGQLIDELTTKSAEEIKAIKDYEHITFGKSD